jgi:hypothetical protein
MTSLAKLEELDAIRKKAGLCIDPKTAELHWEWGQMVDPYGDLAEPPKERVYFARSPDSDGIWVAFRDLPEATREALRQPTVEELDAIRKKAGLGIDPKTAELHWEWGQIGDPYGDFPEPPKEYYCVGRVYFARSPGSDGIWVEFGDLPQATVDALWERMSQPISPEPRWGSDEDYFFNPARVLKGADKAEVTKEISLYTDAELTTAVSIWEAWVERMKHGAGATDPAIVAALEGRSPLHLELEARRSRAALRLSEHPSTSTEVSMTDG